MAIGFQYRKVENFPSMEVGESFKTGFQLNLISGVDRDLSSEVRFVGESDNAQFWKYHVTHESWRAMRVRFENQIRDRVIEIVEFHLFIPKRGREFLYADAKSRYCNELLRRIQDIEPKFEFSAREVDLSRMRREAQMDISGGWFRDLQIAEVSAAAIFGSNVSDSSDWDRYEASGTVSMLDIDFIFRGRRELVKVTREGAIVIMSTLEESERLELVSSVNQMVDRFAFLL